MVLDSSALVALVMAEQPARALFEVLGGDFSQTDLELVPLPL